MSKSFESRIPRLRSSSREKEIPESRLPLPTSSLIRSSRHSRHFDNTHIDANPYDKQQYRWSSHQHHGDDDRQGRFRSKQDKRSTSEVILNVGRNSPKRFSLCFNDIDSSDEADYCVRQHSRYSQQKNPRPRGNQLILSAHQLIADNRQTVRHQHQTNNYPNYDPLSSLVCNSQPQPTCQSPRMPYGASPNLSSPGHKDSLQVLRNQSQTERRQTGPRKSSLPVRCVPLTASGGRTVTVTEGQVRKAAGGLEGDTGTGTCSEEAKYSRKLGDTKCKEVFKFDQEEEVKKPQPKSETNFAAPRHGPELDYRLNCDLRVAGKRRRRRKRSDPSKNASKSQPASQSSTSSVSGGSKRSSVVSDSNDSNLDSSSLGILSPTEIHSNCSLSASINSLGSMTSSMQASWMASVKRMTSAEVAFDDLEADDTLAEDTTSSASATVSSNPSTSSSCSLPRKSSHPMTMRKSSSLVPRPSNEKISRNVEHSHGNELPTKKIQKFHLDTETVREIESLDSSNSDSLIPTFRSFDPTTHAQKINNFFPSKIPSRLPRKIYNEPSFPDVSDLFLARTEELLRSSRAKSAKKRRHTTNVEPVRQELEVEIASKVIQEVDSDSSAIDVKPRLIRQNTFDLPPSPSKGPKAFENPPLMFEPNQVTKSFMLSDVDAGIGNSMPSSVISNNSMITSQDIGMGLSQYEMESSGVFSDADPGRKSTIEPKSVQGIPEEDKNSINEEPLHLVTNDDNFEGPEIEEGQNDPNDEVESVENDIDNKENREDENIDQAEVNDLGKPKELAPPGLRHERSSLSRPRNAIEAPPKRPRSQEAKGLATKRSELLQEKPIVPNTNVGSKLKEFLARQPSSVEKSDQPRKAKLPGKWDAIMISIAEGQKRKTDSELADRVRDVKSKVFADFKPPIIRKLRPSTTPDRIESGRYSRSNSNMSSISNAQIPSSSCTVSRSSSNMSSVGLKAKNVSRSNSHCSSESQLIKQVMMHASRSNSLCSNASSGRGSELTLKGVRQQSREKSNCNLRSRTGSANKDVPKVAPPMQQPAPPTRTRKVSAPAPPTKKLSINTKVLPTNTKSGQTGLNTKLQSSNTKPGSNPSTVNYHQPDLVKVSSPAPNPNHDLEQKNLQLRQRLSHNAKAFTAMAVALNYFQTELNSLDSRIKRQELSSLRQTIEDQKRSIANLRESFAIELAQYKDTSARDHEIVVRLNELQEQHRAFVDKLLCDHQVELERVKETHRLDMISFGSEQEEVIRQLEGRHRVQLEEVENRWKSKLSQKFECQSMEKSRQETELERKEEQWSEARRTLEDQIHQLRAELKEREEEMNVKHKGDSALRSSTLKLTKITAEADSLKAVLEMKSEELRNLRADKLRLEEKLVDFDQMQAELHKSNALVEDLKAQIESKNSLERKLSYENRKLHQTMEREIHEKKKLSQENEELHWRIRQSFSNSTLEGAPLTTSLIDYSTSATNPMFTSLQQTTMSASFTTDSGCPQSLPSFTARALSRAANSYRPLSAPPDKFDFLPKGGSTSTPHRPGVVEPDSPRVLEVVEKMESVSWKLEYNESESDMSSSPNLKRKLSPHSPMSIRKSTRSGKGHSSVDPMSRSMVDNRSCSSPFSDIMARSCVSLSRSNSSSSRKKLVSHFEPLNEIEPETKSRQGSHCNDVASVKSTNSSNLSSISDEEDIGDISSSSEIEINDPVVDVTTPQIEAMQFMFGSTNGMTKQSSEMSSPDGELTLRDELAASLSGSVMGNCGSNKKNRSRKSEGIMSKSMQINGPSKSSLMSNSLPSYDLNRIFKGNNEVLQNSGGESLMARFEEEDPLVMSGMTDSTSTESDEPMVAANHQIIDDSFRAKRQPSMAESLAGVSWSDDFDQMP